MEESRPRLRTVAGWFPEIVDASLDNDGLPSCSAAEIGEILLEARVLTVWRKVPTEGPPAALDVTLTGLRVDEGTKARLGQMRSRLAALPLRIAIRSVLLSPGAPRTWSTAFRFPMA